MTAPDGKIRSPLNEEGAGGKGQIEEYLRAFNGEGIQHIAFSCDDLYVAWDKLKALGNPFAPAPPATYYEMLEERLPGHGESVEGLQSRSEEHTSELQSLMRISYAVFCLKKKQT